MADGRHIISPVASVHIARSDTGPVEVLDALQLLLQVEYLQSALFALTAAATGLVPTADAIVFSTIGTHASQHLVSITAAITTRSGTPAPSPTFDFTVKGAFPGFAFAAGQYPTLQMLAHVIEDLSVRAYLGQIASLATDKTALNTARTILTVKARHASEIRRLRGRKGWITGNSRDDLPPFAQSVYDGEDNVAQGSVDVATAASGVGGMVPATEAFDEPLTKEQVGAILALFAA
jgi:hypothetical protein